MSGIRTRRYRNSGLETVGPISYVGWNYTHLASGSSLGVTIPVDAVADDLLIATMACTITGRSWNLPVGWNVLHQQGAPPWSQYIYKFHNGTPGTVNFNGPNTSRRVASIVAFRNVDSSDPFGPVTTHYESSTTDPVLTGASADPNCSMVWYAANLGTTGEMGNYDLIGPTSATRDVATSTQYGGVSNDVGSLAYHKSCTQSTFPTTFTLDTTGTGSSRIMHMLMVGLNAV